MSLRKKPYSLRNLFDKQKRTIFVQSNSLDAKRQGTVRGKTVESGKRGIRRLRGRPRTIEIKSISAEKRTKSSYSPIKEMKSPTIADDSLSPNQREPPQLELMPAIDEDSELSLLPSLISIDDHLRPGKCILLCPSFSCRKRFSNPIELISHMRNIHTFNNKFEDSLFQLNNKAVLKIYACPICLPTQFSTHTTSSDINTLSEHTDRYHGKNLSPNQFLYFCTIFLDVYDEGKLYKLKNDTISEDVTADRDREKLSNQHQYNPILPLVSNSHLSSASKNLINGITKSYVTQPASNTYDLKRQPRLARFPRQEFNYSTTFSDSLQRQSVQTPIALSKISPHTEPDPSKINLSSCLKNSSTLIKPCYFDPTSSYPPNHLGLIYSQPTTTSLLNSNGPAVPTFEKASTHGTTFTTPLILSPSNISTFSPKNDSIRCDSSNYFLQNHIPVLLSHDFTSKELRDSSKVAVAADAIATLQHLIQTVAYSPISRMETTDGLIHLTSSVSANVNKQNTGPYLSSPDRRLYFENDRVNQSDPLTNATTALTCSSFLQPLGLTSDPLHRLDFEHQTPRPWNSLKCNELLYLHSSPNSNQDYSHAQTGLTTELTLTSCSEQIPYSSSSAMDLDLDNQLSPSLASCGLHTLADLSVRQAAEFQDKLSSFQILQEQNIPTNSSYSYDEILRTSQDSAGVLDCSRSSVKQNDAPGYDLVRNKRLLPRKFNKNSTNDRFVRCSISCSHNSTSGLSPTSCLPITRRSLKSVPIKVLPKFQPVISINESFVTLSPNHDACRKGTLSPLAMKPSKDVTSSAHAMQTLIAIRPVTSPELGMNSLISTREPSSTAVTCLPNLISASSTNSELQKLHSKSGMLYSACNPAIENIGVLNPIIPLLCDVSSRSKHSQYKPILPTTTSPITTNLSSGHTVLPIVLEPLYSSITTALDNIKSRDTSMELPSCIGLQHTAGVFSSSITESRTTPIFTIPVDKSCLPLLSFGPSSVIQENNSALNSAPVRCTLMQHFKLKERRSPLVNTVATKTYINSSPQWKQFPITSCSELQSRPNYHRSVALRSTHLQKILPRPQNLTIGAKENQNAKVDRRPLELISGENFPHSPRGSNTVSSTATFPNDLLAPTPLKSSTDTMSVSSTSPYQLNGNHPHNQSVALVSGSPALYPDSPTIVDSITSSAVRNMPTQSTESSNSIG